MNDLIVNDLTPPYFAVIFTSIQTENIDNYGEMSSKMEKLVAKQDGFLGFESARDQVGITVSYWSSLESINQWRKNEAHQVAQNKGREEWYKAYRIRICKVEKEYGRTLF